MYHFYLWLVKLLALMPLRRLYALSDVLAFIVFRVIRYRVQVVRHNIDLCFPHLSSAERASIVSGFYRHLTDVIVESLWVGGSGKKKFQKAGILEVVNPKVINGIHASGKSAVILCSHICNWELLGGVVTINSSETPLMLSENNYTAVYKKLNGELWNKIMQHNRTIFMDDPSECEGYLETHDVLRYVVRHKDEQKFYNFITDQRPYRAAKATAPAEFLGQKCKTMVAAANVAHHFGFAVVYQRMLSAGRGRYTLEYVPICGNGAESSPQEIMDRYYELLTADVRLQPCQYLWSHKRFKTKKKKSPEQETQVPQN